MSNIIFYLSVMVLSKKNLIIEKLKMALEHDLTEDHVFESLS